MGVMAEGDDDFYDWPVPADQLPAGVASMVRTCLSCPVQYDLLLEDGRYGYFRARHGRWSFMVYLSSESDAHGEDPVMAAAGEAEPEPDHPEVVAILEEFLPRFIAEWPEIRVALGIPEGARRRG